MIIPDPINPPSAKNRRSNVIAFSNEAHLFFAATNDALRRFIRD